MEGMIDFYTKWCSEDLLLKLPPHSPVPGMILSSPAFSSYSQRDHRTLYTLAEAYQSQEGRNERNTQVSSQAKKRGSYTSPGT